MLFCDFGNAFYELVDLSCHARQFGQVRFHDQTLLPERAHNLTEMEFVVEQRENLPPVVHLTFSDDDGMTTFTDALALAENAGSDAPIWVHGTTPERRQELLDQGLVSNRTLLQMFRELPAAPTTVETRAFEDSDISEFVAVNNRAFSWHPEQSGLTEAAVRGDIAQPWFDYEGFRLHHIDEQLAGFCWTRVHEDVSNTPGNPEPVRVGEIYVIAVDQPFHGRGLGKAMTLAGLEYLASLGITVGMLYVESDNEAAVATYERIGFSVGRTDTLWTRES